MPIQYRRHYLIPERVEVIAVICIPDFQRQKFRRAVLRPFDGTGLGPRLN